LALSAATGVTVKIRGNSKCHTLCW